MNAPATASIKHPDAKLVELGRRLERAKAEARPFDKERERLFAVYEAAAEAAGTPDYNDGGRDAHQKIMRECGYKAASDAFNAKIGEAVTLMRAIHRERPTTIEGIAVKLAAISFDIADFELEPDNGDVAEHQVHRLAKQVQKLAKAQGGAS